MVREQHAGDVAGRIVQLEHLIEQVTREFDQITGWLQEDNALLTSLQSHYRQVQKQLGANASHDALAVDLHLWVMAPLETHIAQLGRTILLEELERESLAARFEHLRLAVAELERYARQEQLVSP